MFGRFPGSELGVGQMRSGKSLLYASPVVRFWMFFIIAALSLVGLFAGLRNFISVISMTNLLSYQVEVEQNPIPEYLAIMPVFLLLPLFFAEDRERKLRRLAQVLSPLLLLYPLLWFAWDNFFFLPLSLILFGWSAFRACSMFSGVLYWKWARGRHFHSAWIPVLVGMLYVVGIFWGFSMQAQAYRSMFLLYSDWGTYADGYLNLLKTGGPAWWNWLSTGAHWNPFVNLVMTGAMWIYPRAETVFAMNSIVIYSAVPLSYVLGRAGGLSRGISLFFAVAAFLNPSYSHMNLTLFYGFHPVNFIIPLLLLFFLFREKNSRLGMGIVFCLTLMVQETMMIFWVGYGLYLLVRREWRIGLALILFSSLGFVFLSSWVLPRICGTNVYPLSFLFDTLGRTPAEIALSPIHKASVFWSTFFQWQNFAFLLTLMIPFFFCLWVSPSMMIAMVPLLAGIFMRSSIEVKSIMFQYGVETTTLFLALALLNVCRTMRKEPSRLPSLLNVGMKKYPSKTLALALCAATAVTVLGAYQCFAMTKFIGKCTLDNLFPESDVTDLIREMKEIIPPGSRILSTERLRAHFMFDFPTDRFTASRRPGDILILNFYDVMMNDRKTLERVRREIAFDKRVVPLMTCLKNDQQFIVCRVMDSVNVSMIRKLPVVEFAEFDSLGVPIPETDPHFAGRYVNMNGKYLFRWQIRKTPEYDVDIKVFLECSHGTVLHRQAFGFGLFPAYSLEPGSVFQFEVNLPGVRNIQVEVVKLPFSDGKEK